MMTGNTLIFVSFCFALVGKVLTMESVPSAELLTLLSDDTSNIDECNEDCLLNCTKAMANMEVFKSLDVLEFPGGQNLKRNHKMNGMQGSYSYSYKNLDSEPYAEAFITYSHFNGIEALDGYMILPNNKVYFLENCGQDCHVLLVECHEKENPYEEEPEEDPTANRELTPEMEKMIAQSRQANVVDVSVIVYYTSDFLSVTSNFLSYINNEVQLTQTGYDNTNIEINLILHCAREINITENPNSSPQRLNDFLNNFGGSVVDLLDSADMAILLTASTVPFVGGQICGQAATINVPASGGLPIGWAGKGCFLTFAHEIGHLFGARHDRGADNSDPFVNFAHGWQIPNTPFYTVMSTSNSASGHTTRVNFYSNIFLTAGGNPMGDDGSNNRQIFTDNKLAMSQIGDESNACEVEEVCENVLDDDDCNTRGCNGECQSNAAFMGENCPLSCGLCCGDAFPSSCPIWAAKGFCESSYEAFMMRACVKTCTECALA